MTTPTEAATPELDSADLGPVKAWTTLFGADEELDERDPILLVTTLQTAGLP